MKGQLTKKHFIRIAEIIKHYGLLEKEQGFVLDLCSYFHYENPNFNRDLFLKECGVEK